jgi:NADH:ubiquinone oxidoreductase subunit 3 (subunit A)
MEKEHFFDKPKNVKRFLMGFYISLVLLIVVDLFLTLLHLKHPDFSWEKFPSFYGAFGFIACVLLVLAAKHILRKCVKREEDYYD